MEGNAAGVVGQFRCSSTLFHPLLVGIWGVFHRTVIQRNAQDSCPLFIDLTCLYHCATILSPVTSFSLPVCSRLQVCLHVYGALSRRPGVVREGSFDYRVRHILGYSTHTHSLSGLRGHRTRGCFMQGYCCDRIVENALHITTDALRAIRARYGLLLTWSATSYKGGSQLTIRPI